MLACVTRGGGGCRVRCFVPKTILEWVCDGAPRLFEHGGEWADTLTGLFSLPNKESAMRQVTRVWFFRDAAVN